MKTALMLKYLIAKNLPPVIAIVISLVSLTLVFNLNKQAKTPEVAGTSLVNLDVFDDKIASISAQQGDFSSKVDSLTEQNSKLKSQVDACKKFVPAFFQFYEKASEMFANGISGCAIKYVQAGKPTELPGGCHRWIAWKGITGWESSGWWQQDPDQKYYDSLKNLYNNYIKYQATCQN